MRACKPDTPLPLPPLIKTTVYTKGSPFAGPSPKPFVQGCTKFAQPCTVSRLVLIFLLLHSTPLHSSPPQNSLPRCARDGVCWVRVLDDISASLWVQQRGVQPAGGGLCPAMVHHHLWGLHLHRPGTRRHLLHHQGQPRLVSECRECPSMFWAFPVQKKEKGAVLCCCCCCNRGGIFQRSVLGISLLQRSTQC